MMEWDTHALAISRLRTGGLGIKTIRTMMFLIEPVTDRLLARCMEMFKFHTSHDAA